MYCVFQSRSFLWGEINFHNKPNKDSLFIIFTFDPNLLIESLQCTCNKQQVLTSIFFCSSWKDTYFQDLQPNTKKNRSRISLSGLPFVWFYPAIFIAPNHFTCGNQEPPSLNISHQALHHTAPSPPQPRSLNLILLRQ